MSYKLFRRGKDIIITGNAVVYSDEPICFNLQVLDTVLISGNAQVFDEVLISEKAQILDTVLISEKAQVFGMQGDAADTVRNNR
jgi:hypothetical protein